MPERKILISAADGQTGHLCAELLLVDDEFNSRYSGLTLMCGDPSKCDDLLEFGPEVISVDYEEETVHDLARKMESCGADALYLIPPASGKKVQFVEKMVEATKMASIPNVLFLSSAGCDLAEWDKQPQLREFIGMEALVMESKGDTTTETGHSPVIIRAAFYAENLLLYNKNAQTTGKLPLPVGRNHKFAPLALGDLAYLAAEVLVSEGPHGFSDDVRGQLIVLTGPQLCSGDELAEAASQALGTKMDYEEITDDRARQILDAQGDIDESEIQYLLEYYSLVREGKTNYVSTLAFKHVTAAEPTLPSEFFESYSEEFRPKRRRTTGHHHRARRGAHSAAGHSADEKAGAHGKGRAAAGKRGRRT